mmetsp:Transcript_39692/g.102785  ORF Transcript_39692/g.102785 Transcript_39692/m.102785 type:complete len:316 (-) Transcript_39692:1199-2146(-)
MLSTSHRRSFSARLASDARSCSLSTARPASTACFASLSSAAASLPRNAAVSSDRIRLAALRSACARCNSCAIHRSRCCASASERSTRAARSLAAPASAARPRSRCWPALRSCSSCCLRDCAAASAATCLLIAASALLAAACRDATVAVCVWIILATWPCMTSSSAARLIACSLAPRLCRMCCSCCSSWALRWAAAASRVLLPSSSAESAPARSCSAMRSFCPSPAAVRACCSTARHCSSPSSCTLSAISVASFPWASTSPRLGCRTAPTSTPWSARSPFHAPTSRQLCSASRRTRRRSSSDSDAAPRRECTCDSS